MADSAAAVRVFSDDGVCVSDAVLMRRSLEYVKAFDGVIAQHAQEPRLTEGAQMNEGELSGILGLPGWPAVAEEAVIARDVLLRRARRPSAARLPRLHRRLGRTAALGEEQGHRRDGGGDAPPPAAHRRPGPHVRPDLQGFHPPLTADDARGLRAALADGTIDCVATDHAPHAVEDKESEWAEAAFGMVGLETALSVVQQVMLDEGLLDWAGVADRCPRGRLVSAGSRVRVNRSPFRQPGEPHPSTPRRAGRLIQPRWPRAAAIRPTPA